MAVKMRRKTKRGLLEVFNAVPTGGIKYGYSDREDKTIYPSVRPQYAVKGEPPPTVTQVAIKNNFGLEGIPARNFMFIGRASAIKEAIKVQKALTRRLLIGEISEEKYVGLIGEKIVSSYKQTITNLKTPPNSARTITIKGSSNPLIDTGLMKNSFGYWPIKKAAK